MTNQKLSIDKKIHQIRMDILRVETELQGMLYPKDERGEGFLPAGNEILFDFKKTRYENMMYDIHYALQDLKLIKHKSEKIWEITNNK